MSKNYERYNSEGLKLVKHSREKQIIVRIARICHYKSACSLSLSRMSALLISQDDSKWSQGWAVKWWLMNGLSRTLEGVRQYAGWRYGFVVYYTDATFLVIKHVRSYLGQSDCRNGSCRSLLSFWCYHALKEVNTSKPNDADSMLFDGS